jgi:di/tripeptidase
MSLQPVQDDVGNLVIRKPARPGREASPMALLQGHLDMVREKNEGTVHDFDADPIRVSRDGDWLKADGTTLGSDNGVGVSAALAVMESHDIHHGPLDTAMYRKRNEIEGLFRRLKGFHRIFSRFDKLDVIFLGFISP